MEKQKEQLYKMSAIELNSTIPKMLKRNYERWGASKTALRHKKYGIFQEYTWKDYFDHVKHFALGLKSLGLEEGDRVTIIGDNEPEWVIAQLAVMSLGGIAAGAYQDALAEEIAYVINQSGSKFVVVEDQEQVDKILETKDNCPNLIKAIWWDPKGLRNYSEDLLISFEDVQKLGREYEKNHPGFFESSIDSRNPEDICMIYYTSGTTSQPKGVVYTHKTLLAASICSEEAGPVKENDEFVSFIPMAWPTEQMIFMIPAMEAGGVVNFPEEPETAEENMREVGLVKAFISPRQLEAQCHQAQIKYSDASYIKRKVYDTFMPVGYKMVEAKIAGERPKILWRILNKVADLLLFRQLRDWFGYSKTRCLITGGAAIIPDVLRYFLAIGVNIKCLYGMVECPCATIHNENDIDPESAGVPRFKTEIRISDEGEILMRGPQRMVGYFQNVEATSKTIDKQGWVHSGDAGFITEKGHLVCVDRVSDLMTLKDGARFSPLFIESKLKFSPYIKDAIAVGDGKDYITAMIAINFAYVGNWAEKNHIAYTTFPDLSQKDETYELIAKEIARVNRLVPENIRIKKFALLPKELDADDAELTRTRKLRRKFVEQRYADLIKALYGEAANYVVESDVTYRDGRKGKVKTEIKIVSV